MRTTASVEPPGGKVTMMRIGFVGHAVGAAVCAPAARAAAASPIAIQARRAMFMQSPLDGAVWMARW